MKKLNYLIYLFIIMVISVPSVFAASISVKTSSTSVTVGNTVRVTVSVSGSNADAWEYCLSYDSSSFTLTSPSNPCVLGGLLAGNSSVTFTLKSISSGTSTVGVKDVQVLDEAANAVSTTKGSVSITARTQQEIEASYSTNADLKSLSVDGYDLSPSFSKNTLDYTLEVENDVEKVKISASKSDSGARVTGTGEKELSEGVNKFDIVVTAEKGNKKTYTITINRKELNPITVNVNGNSYNIVRKSETLEAPTYYSETTTLIDDEEVPAFTSEITGYTLVGLKDEEGNIYLYIYENNSYRLYKQVGNDGFIFIIEESADTIKGYENKKSITINDIETDIYYKNEDDEIVLIYGMNASNGVKNWYSYDIKEGTFQRYINEESDNITVSSEYFYLTIIFAGCLALSILIIIILLAMMSKKDKQRNKLIEYIESKKIKKELDNVEVKEKLSEVIEEEIEDITPKKTKKKKSTVDEDTIDPELEKLNTQFLDFIDKSAQDQKEVKENETELSKREIRRLEKEQKESKEKELKEISEEFLNTTENEIVDDSDIIEEVETNKKTSKKSKKKKRSK